MFGFLKFAMIGFAGLTLLYFLLSIYMRSVRRENLEEEWTEEGSIGARDDYVEQGLQDYAKSFRPKLLLLVYILPTIAFVAVFFVTN